MKTTILNILTGILILGGVFFMVSCTSKSEAGEKITFKVYGNCEMCKKTIEGSLKEFSGLSSASWDVDKKIITVSFDSSKTNLSEIHKQIASSGYDTELEKGNDVAYQNLQPCCQYDRKK